MLVSRSFSEIPALDQIKVILFSRAYQDKLFLNVLLLSGAGLDMINDHPESSDEDSTDQKPLIPGHLGEHEDYSGPGLGAGRGKPTGPPTPAGGKKTKGRVKIKMEFIDNKLRRYTTFSKRKTGIMKKVRSRRIRGGRNRSFYVCVEPAFFYLQRQLWTRYISFLCLLLLYRTPHA